MDGSEVVIHSKEGQKAGPEKLICMRKAAGVAKRTDFRSVGRFVLLFAMNAVKMRNLFSGPTWLWFS